MGVGFGQIAGELLQPRCGGNGLRRGVITGDAVDDHKRPQRRILAGDGIEACAKFGIGDRDARAGIRQIKLQQVRRRQRVDQQRHQTGAHRAEKRRWIGRGVVEEHQDAVAALQPQRLEAVAPLASLGAELRITAGSARAGERQPVAVPVRKVVEQNPAGVVALRNRKADLGCTRTI